jgi:hypothetical protein
MKFLDLFDEILKSARVGFPPSIKELETLRALAVLEGLTASVVLPELAEADE